MIHKYSVEIHGFAHVYANDEDEAISYAQDGLTLFEELEFGPAIVLESEDE